MLGLLWPLTIVIPIVLSFSKPVFIVCTQNGYHLYPFSPMTQYQETYWGLPSHHMFVLDSFLNIYWNIPICLSIKSKQCKFHHKNHMKQCMLSRKSNQKMYVIRETKQKIAKFYQWNQIKSCMLSGNSNQAMHNQGC